MQIYEITGIHKFRICWLFQWNLVSIKLVTKTRHIISTAFNLDSSKFCGNYWNLVSKLFWLKSYTNSWKILNLQIFRKGKAQGYIPTYVFVSLWKSNGINLKKWPASHSWSQKYFPRCLLNRVKTKLRVPKIQRATFLNNIVAVNTVFS